MIRAGLRLRRASGIPPAALAASLGGFPAPVHPRPPRRVTRRVRRGQSCRRARGGAERRLARGDAPQLRLARVQPEDVEHSHLRAGRLRLGGFAGEGGRCPAKTCARLQAEALRRIRRLRPDVLLLSEHLVVAPFRSRADIASSLAAFTRAAAKTIVLGHTPLPQPWSSCLVGVDITRCFATARRDVPERPEGRAAARGPRGRDVRRHVCLALRPRGRADRVPAGDRRRTCIQGRNAHLGRVSAQAHPDRAGAAALVRRARRPACPLAGLSPPSASTRPLAQ